MLPHPCPVASVEGSGILETLARVNHEVDSRVVHLVGPLMGPARSMLQGIPNPFLPCLLLPLSSHGCLLLDQPLEQGLDRHQQVGGECIAPDLQEANRRCRGIFRSRNRSPGEAKVARTRLQLPDHMVLALPDASHRLWPIHLHVHECLVDPPGQCEGRPPKLLHDADAARDLGEMCWVQSWSVQHWFPHQLRGAAPTAMSLLILGRISLAQ